LLRRSLTAREFRHGAVAQLIPAAVIAGTIPLALVSSTLPLLCWISIGPLEAIWDRRDRGVEPPDRAPTMPA
jgi:hypothetical protein